MFNQKKKYFKKKAEAIKRMIWDLEFKKEKTLMIREEVRREYDGVQAKLNIVEEKIKGFPKLSSEKPEDQEKEKKELWSDEQRGVDDERIRLEITRDRHQAQMKQLDVDVFGSKKTNEYPDGVDGIEQQLDALRELLGMVKEYLKKI